jgi:hypothetical protein
MLDASADRKAKRAALAREARRLGEEWKTSTFSLNKSAPRNRGRVRLLICPYCSIPRRGLYGWEPGGRFTDSVLRSTWGCRKCNGLRFASEGGALLIRPRGTLGLVFGTGHSPRPESWLLTCSPHLKWVLVSALNSDCLMGEASKSERYLFSAVNRMAWFEILWLSYASRTAA